MSGQRLGQRLTLLERHAQRVNGRQPDLDAAAARAGDQVARDTGLPVPEVWRQFDVEVAQWEAELSGTSDNQPGDAGIGTRVTTAMLDVLAGQGFTFIEVMDEYRRLDLEKERNDAIVYPTA